MDYANETYTSLGLCNCLVLMLRPFTLSGRGIVPCISKHNSINKLSLENLFVIDPFICGTFEVFAFVSRHMATFCIVLCKNLASDSV